MADIVGYLLLIILILIPVLIFFLIMSLIDRDLEYMFPYILLVIKGRQKKDGGSGLGTSSLGTLYCHKTRSKRGMYAAGHARTNVVGSRTTVIMTFVHSGIY